MRWCCERLSHAFLKPNVREILLTCQNVRRNCAFLVRRNDLEMLAIGKQTRLTYNFGTILKGARVNFPTQMSLLQKIYHFLQCSHLDGILSLGKRWKKADRKKLGEYWSHKQQFWLHVGGTFLRVQIRHGKGCDAHRFQGQFTSASRWYKRRIWGYF